MISGTSKDKKTTAGDNSVNKSLANMTGVKEFHTASEPPMHQVLDRANHALMGNKISDLVRAAKEIFMAPELSMDLIESLLEISLRLNQRSGTQKLAIQGIIKILSKIEKSNPLSNQIIDRFIKNSEAITDINLRLDVFRCISEKADLQSDLQKKAVDAFERNADEIKDLGLRIKSWRRAALFATPNNPLKRNAIYSIMRYARSLATPKVVANVLSEAAYLAEPNSGAEKQAAKDFVTYVEHSSPDVLDRIKTYYKATQRSRPGSALHMASIRQIIENTPKIKDLSHQAKILRYALSQTERDSSDEINAKNSLLGIADKITTLAERAAAYQVIFRRTKVGSSKAEQVGLDLIKAIQGFSSPLERYNIAREVALQAKGGGFLELAAINALKTEFKSFSGMDRVKKLEAVIEAAKPQSLLRKHVALGLLHTGSELFNPEERKYAYSRALLFAFPESAEENEAYICLRDMREIDPKTERRYKFKVVDGKLRL